mmetsp:Transcript_4009/g.10127  ORF Transcript_4009/g.10127 Transcript_4009/m.10127 type:complete len:301 (+) Transcript_4009:416-1318(+)
MAGQAREERILRAVRGARAPEKERAHVLLHDLRRRAFQVPPLPHWARRALRHAAAEVRVQRRREPGGHLPVCGPLRHPELLHQPGARHLCQAAAAQPRRQAVEQGLVRGVPPLAEGGPQFLLAGVQGDERRGVGRRHRRPAARVRQREPPPQGRQARDSQGAAAEAAAAGVPPQGGAPVHVPHARHQRRQGRQQLGVLGADGHQAQLLARAQPQQQPPEAVPPAPEPPHLSLLPLPRGGRSSHSRRRTMAVRFLFLRGWPARFTRCLWTAALRLAQHAAPAPYFATHHHPHYSPSLLYLR